MINRAWYAMCTPYLYNLLLLEDLSDEVIPIICHSPRNMCRHVKTIRLMDGHFDLDTMRHNLTLLISHCQNVEAFESDDENMSYGWWSMFLQVMQEGYVWQRIKKIPDTIRENDNMELYYRCANELKHSLASLQLLGPRFTTLNVSDVDMLSNYSCLNMLNIFPRIGYSNYQDYELLLRYANRVTELIVDWHDLGLTQEELSTMEAHQLRRIPEPIDIYPRLKSLTVGGCFSHETVYSSQIRYFLQKFPGLQEIYLTIHSSAPLDDYCIRCLIRIPLLVIKIRYATTLIQILQSFARIRGPTTLRVEYLPEFRFLRQMTIQFNITARDTHCHIDGEYQDEFASSVTSEVLTILGERINMLTIEHPGHFWSGFNLAAYGDHCPNMHSLRICFIEVNRYGPELYEKHIQLTEIILKRSTIHDGVFKEMSNALPNLSNLTINSCSFASLEVEPMHIMMDMPFTQFKLLDLDFGAFVDKQFLVRIFSNDERCMVCYIYQEDKLLCVPTFVVKELYANYFPHFITLSLRCKALNKLVLQLKTKVSLTLK
ncbi:hypothetical protein G6F56_007336 [Rhizopus delemar]|nr:hypothetical protein G6F56_007336 [Rhizopus delemar]